MNEGKNETNGRTAEETVVSRTTLFVQHAIVNLCRLVVAVTFIVSGFVKAIDPLGTQYKIEDYAAAVGIM